MTEMLVINRTEAKARGLTRYFTDQPCPQGHIAPRFVSNYACEKCIQEHPDKGPGRNQRKRRQRRERWAREQEERAMRGIMLWKDARDLGLKRYFTGQPCNRGHISERLVSNMGCLVCSAEKRARHRMDHPEIWKRSQAIWAAKHPDKIKQFRQTQAHRLERKIATNLHVRLIRAIKQNSRTGSAVRDLGCSIAELIQYFEGLFKPGMTWENWGEVWEIDHRKPLAVFDLTKRDEVQIACHHTNLQPLFNQEHRTKTKRDIGSIVHSRRVGSICSVVYQVIQSYPR
jgi:hypothetical protein